MVYFYSLSITPEIGKILYLVLITVLFVSFNTVALWRVTDAVIQFIILCLMFISLNILKVIDLKQILLLGGYTALSVSAVSVAFPAIRMLALRERVEKQLLVDKQLADALRSKEGIEKEYNHNSAKILSFQKEIKVLRHDLKNRLGSIESLIELIELEKRYIQEMGQYDYMQLIKSSISDLSNSTDSLFDFFNKEDISNSTTIIKTPVDLHNVLQNNKYKFFESTSSKNIRLNFSLMAKDSLIFVDKNMIDVAVHNLMKYALKFSKNNDTLEINTRLAQNRIYLEIINRNSGISMSEMERHFKNIDDYQLKDLHYSKGLGLGIAKHYIEILDGHLSYSSSLSLGFEFIVDFQLNAFK